MGWMAAVAGVAFGLAMVMLAIFFRRRDSRYDRVAEWAFVVFAVLAVPTMLAVAGRIGATGVVGGILTAIGIIGAVVVGLSELGTTFKLVDFQKVAPYTTLAFLGFLVWIGGISVTLIASASPALPVGLGWLGILSIVVGVAIIGWIIRIPGVITGRVEPGETAMTAFFVPMAGIVGWMVWLGAVL